MISSFSTTSCLIYGLRCIGAAFVCFYFWDKSILCVRIYSLLYKTLSRSDGIKEARIYLLEKMRDKQILSLDISGEWGAVDFEKTEDGVFISSPVESCKSVYIMLK